jgi:SAM-dependent methyltransferase
MCQGPLRASTLLLPLIFLSFAVSFAQAPLPQTDTKALGLSWDKAYLDDKPAFNIEPNSFLVETVRSLKAARALDVGMGQGRNALFLAERGWDVTGFDVSEVAVAQASEQARKRGLRVNGLIQSSDEFDWGKNRWDLIVITYFPQLRQSVQKIVESLTPGGVVLVEAFHKDAALDRPPGPGPSVSFETNELLTMFASLRIVQYQDVRARADWGLFETRLVRLVAQKP